MENEILVYFIGGCVATIFCLLIAIVAIGTFFRGIWSPKRKGDVFANFSFTITVLIVLGISISIPSGDCFGESIRQSKEREQKDQQRAKEKKIDEQCEKSAQLCYLVCTNNYPGDDYCIRQLDFMGFLKRFKENDLKKAFEYYDYGCRLKNARSCSSLAYMYHDINGDKAVEFHKKACGLGSGHDCFLLGLTYKHGLMGVIADQQESFHFHEKACEASSSEGCELLAFMYYKGESVAQNHNKANELFKKPAN